MKYKIKCFFETGNSFGSHKDSEILEVEYNCLDKAKEALRRIKEHYEWYEDFRRYEWQRKNVPCPTWWNCKYSYESEKYHLLNLPTESGKDFQMAAPWCGYFEELHGARVILDDPDLEFSLK